MSTLSVACGDKSDDTADTGHGDHTDHDGGDETGGDETGGDETGGDETGGDETGGDETGGDETGGDETGGDETGGDETGGDDGPVTCEPTEPTVTELTGYYFDSHFIEGESAVSNTGQIMRQNLITELKGYIGDLKDMADSGGFAEGDIVSGLNYYFDFDGDTSAEDSFYYSPDLAIQETWGEISTKNLKGKLAGNDSKTDHRPWSDSTDEETGEVTISEFYGWDADGVNSPESLVTHWFGEIEAQVLLYQEAVAGDSILDHPPYLTEDGVDRKQLIQKFLTGAVTFSQGADDYLSNDVDGKGLLASTDCATEDDDVTCKKYSSIGHAWDEGFGYFGGARNYGELDAAAIKANDNDANGDGCIDLITEYNWGGSVNAAKRDLGSADVVDADDASLATNFVGDAWTGFEGGRAIIDAALVDGGPLTEDEMTELLTHRDLAISSWEKAIAATVVHYINDVRADIDSCSAEGEDGFNFADFAKHWGEAKGFALWFQFNPASPLLADADEDGVEDFQALHQLLGMSGPLWTSCDEASEAWYGELETARTLLGAAYGFDDALLEAW